MSNSRFGDQTQGSPMWNTLAVISFGVMVGLIAVQIFADPIWIGYVALSAIASFVCNMMALGNVGPADRRRGDDETGGDAQVIGTLVSLCVIAVTLVWWGVTRWPWF